MHNPTEFRKFWFSHDMYLWISSAIKIGFCLCIYFIPIEFESRNGKIGICKNISTDSYSSSSLISRICLHSQLNHTDLSNSIYRMGRRNIDISLRSKNETIFRHKSCIWFKLLWRSKFIVDDDLSSCDGCRIWIDCIE